MSYTVVLSWDSEASVWVATSEDIKGLVLESGSLDVLIERVRMAVPALLKLNNQPLEHAKIVFLTEKVLEDDEMPELTSDDFKKAVRNPYAQYFREKDSLIVPDRAVEYFIKQAAETGTDWRTLANFYLMDVVKNGKKIKIE